MRTQLEVEIAAGAIDDLASFATIPSAGGIAVAEIADRLLEKMWEGSLENFMERSRPVSKTTPTMRTIQRGPVQLTCMVTGELVWVMSAGLVNKE